MPASSKRVYLGGSKNFDEATGKYTNVIPRASSRLSPGVYRDAKGGLVGSKGQRIASTGPQQGPSGMPSGMDAAWKPMGPGDGIDRTTRAERQRRVDELSQPGAMHNLMAYYLPNGRSVGQLEYERYMLDQPEMGQASANNKGQYRLSPGVYGTQQQAENQARQQKSQWRDAQRPVPASPASGAPSQPPFDMEALLAMLKGFKG